MISNDRCMVVDDIGSQSPAMKEAVAECCFSLQSRRRELNLEARDKRVLGPWTKGVYQLLSRGHAVRGGLGRDFG